MVAEPSFFTPLARAFNDPVYVAPTSGMPIVKNTMRVTYLRIAVW